MKSAPPLRYVEGDPLMFQVLNEIGIVAQLSRSALERTLGDALSGAGFSVLNHLARLGDGKSPAELARAFQVTKGAMTNTLQRLEADGYVRIAQDAQDGRVKRVSLTKAGMKARNAAVAAVTPDLAALQAALPKALLAELLPRLAVLRAAIDSARDR
jgi:DNA-binding MarR family transcriptional regulator